MLPVSSHFPSIGFYHRTPTLKWKAALVPSRVASYATHYSVPSSVIRSLDETAVCKVQPSDSTGTQQTIRLLILTRRHFVAQCFMMQNTVAVAKVTNKSGKHPRLFISIYNSVYWVLFLAMLDTTLEFLLTTYYLYK